VSLAKKLFLEAFWPPLAIFVAHVVLSRVLLAYELFPPLDGPVHVLGGIAIAYAVWHGIEVLVSTGVLEPVQDSIRWVLVSALTCTAAVFWEFLEYISDHTIGTHAQLGLEDTLVDMLLGIAGGLIYLAWKGLTLHRRS
jgi:hypothetical protein